MVVFCDLVGVGIAPVSKKTAVKNIIMTYAFDMCFDTWKYTRRVCMFLMIMYNVH